LGIEGESTDDVLRKAVIETINYSGVLFGNISWKKFNNLKKAKTVTRKPGNPSVTMDI
jgi:hypothetical protein